jgi:hypothetical protein
MRFLMHVLGDNLNFEFFGHFEEGAETALTSMLAAMTEGLEANGYTVESEITYETKVKL